MGFYICGGCGEEKDAQFNFCLCDAAGGGTPVVLGPSSLLQIQSRVNHGEIAHDKIKARGAAQYDVLRDARRVDTDIVHTATMQSHVSTKASHAPRKLGSAAAAWGLTCGHSVCEPGPRERKSLPLRK